MSSPSRINTHASSNVVALALCMTIKRHPRIVRFNTTITWPVAAVYEKLAACAINVNRHCL